MASRMYLVLFVLLLACSNDEAPDGEIQISRIDEPATLGMEEWQVERDGEYPYREDMLDDLMNDPELRALSKDALIKRLGRPDRTNENYVYYTVHQKRLGFFPLHTKSLVIKFYENGPVEWMKIHE